MVPPLLVLAIEFHRAPLRFRRLTDPQHPLPEGFDAWLTEASAALAPDNVVATAEILGATVETLRDAYQFLLRQILLSPKADHYRVLGVSRGCSAECIKQHYSLLVRLFHPDRLPANDEQSLLTTARINAAYQVLRDPHARRRYDSQLPPLSVGAQAWGDPSEFFRADGLLGPASGFTRTPMAGTYRRRPLLLWTVGFAALIALAMAILPEPRHPLLLIDPDLAGEVSQVGPVAKGQAAPRARSESADHSGIGRQHERPPESPPIVAPRAGIGIRGTTEAATSGGEAEGRGPVTSRQEERAWVAVESGTTSGPEVFHVAATQGRVSESAANASASALRNEPPRGAVRIDVPERKRPAQTASARPRTTLPKPADRESGTKAKQPQGISRFVSRLERIFATGDLAALVKLFTANAVVNNGVGAVGVRNLYSAIVGPTRRGHLSISGMKWRSGEHERLLGQGAIRISAMDESRGDSINLSGTVELELVPWMGDYRISKFIHHLPRR